MYSFNSLKGLLHLYKLAEIIQRDAGIFGLVLKTVNSPLFGLRSKVLSINHAINLQGVSYITDIATGLLLQQSLNNSEDLRKDFLEKLPMTH